MRPPSCRTASSAAHPTSSVLEDAGIEPGPLRNSHHQPSNLIHRLGRILSKSSFADPNPDPDPLVRGMDPRIRIHTKMSWIRNTVQVSCFFFIFRTWFPARLVVFSGMISGAGTSPLPPATRHQNQILPDAFESPCRPPWFIFVFGEGWVVAPLQAPQSPDF